MIDPIKSLKRAINEPASPDAHEFAKSLFTLHTHITRYANLDPDRYDAHCIDVSMRTGVNFKVPRQELFMKAEDVCEGFLQGFVLPADLKQLQILIRDEGAKLDPVLKHLGYDPEDHKRPLTADDIMAGARLPSRYLKTIEPYLDAGLVNYSMDVRERIRHIIQSLRDNNPALRPS